MHPEGGTANGASGISFLVNPASDGGKTGKRSNPNFKDRQLEMALGYLRGQIKLADRAKFLRDE